MAIRQGVRLAVPAVVLLCAAWLLISNLNSFWRRLDPAPQPHTSNRPQTPKSPIEVVVASMSHEDTTWFRKYVPWPSNVYVVDNPKAKLTVALNKGREAMVYLTYLIDRYETLPEYVVFIHAERFQWHNDDPDYDSLPSLQRLKFEHLKKEGYVNLRCVWVLGCPVEIRPWQDELATDGRKTSHAYKKAFRELFPDEPVPQEVGVSCCSQFAVTRDTVRRRPREDYIKFRKWLIKTSLTSDISGRILEYSWHMIFGKSAVHCPTAAECYCNLYGLCDLKCEDGACDGRYVLPSVATLPEGWPRVGWDGEERNFTGPL